MGGMGMSNKGKAARGTNSDGSKTTTPQNYALPLFPAIQIKYGEQEHRFTTKNIHTWFYDGKTIDMFIWGVGKITRSGIVAFRLHEILSHYHSHIGGGVYE